MKQQVLRGMAKVTFPQWLSKSHYGKQAPKRVLILQQLSHDRQWRDCPLLPSDALGCPVLLPNMLACFPCPLESTDNTVLIFQRLHVHSRGGTKRGDVSMPFLSINPPVSPESPASFWSHTSFPLNPSFPFFETITLCVPIFLFWSMKMLTPVKAMNWKGNSWSWIPHRSKVKMMKLEGKGS